MSHYEAILKGVSIYAAYYRANPHRFAHDYLHLELHVFQKILIFMMNQSTVLCFIACRGIGKTFISAVFAVIRCILYPGTKICVASGTRGQSINVLEKITLELVPESPELKAEIDDKQTKVNGTNAQIVFKNGSYIKVVTASDNARGNRANVLLLDEFRMISKDTIDTILRKFLTQRRRPRYAQLSKANCDGVSVEDLEEKFFSIAGRNGVNINLAFSHEPTAAPKIPVDKAAPVNDAPYGGLVEKYCRTAGED